MSQFTGVKGDWWSWVRVRGSWKGVTSGVVGVEVGIGVVTVVELGWK